MHVDYCVNVAVKVWVLSVDTPEKQIMLFMALLRQHLSWNGIIVEHAHERQAGTWTVVLHTPAERLDVTRVMQAMGQAGVCGPTGVSGNLPRSAVCIAVCIAAPDLLL